MRNEGAYSVESNGQGISSNLLFGNEKLVSSNLNVILTWQTWGQRSGMAAASKRQALAFYLSVRICYKFPISKCGEEPDLGLCMTAGLANKFQNCLATRFVGSQHCAVAFFLQVPNSCKDLDQTLLYISILGTHSKFVRINKMQALGVCLLQPCPSTGPRFAASRSLVDYYRTIGSFS